MLLITAILFVCIAGSIPNAPDGMAPIKPPVAFYAWLRAMLGFDVGVLLLDWLKARRPDDWAPYPVWITINILMFFECSWALHVASSPTPGMTWSYLSRLVFAAACLRTAADYAAGAGFLVPRRPAPDGIR
jgi:hypothetical protein